MSEELKTDKLATLKARADRLGLQYHPSIGVDKLEEKVNAAMSGDPVKPEASAPAAAPASTDPTVETVGQRKKRMKDEALKLVRIRVACMNPAKKEWDGEIFTVGNNLVGSVRKYVPFNADAGWHVPHIMLQVLQARMCQIFVSGKSGNGVTQRVGKLIREFSIEILDPLTPAEMQELAQRQAMAKSIDQ